MDFPLNTPLMQTIFFTTKQSLHTIMFKRFKKRDKPKSEYKYIYNMSSIPCSKMWQCQILISHRLTVFFSIWSHKILLYRWLKYFFIYKWIWMKWAMVFWKIPLERRNIPLSTNVRAHEKNGLRFIISLNLLWVHIKWWNSFKYSFSLYRKSFHSSIVACHPINKKINFHVFFSFLLKVMKSN